MADECSAPFQELGGREPGVQEADVRDLAAGDFSAWMTEVQQAIRGERSSDVPCGGCTGCCTSSQFIHIAPDETDTLAHIPAAMLFPAPRLPRGHVLVGYDQHGHCPMLIDNACSIYAHRPRTCRTYDCRVFPAARVELDDADKGAIARQTRRWQFSFESPNARVQHDAVSAAAAHLLQHRQLLADDAVPANTTQLAVLAIEVHDAFVEHDPETGMASITVPTPDAVRVMLTSRRRS